MKLRTRKFLAGLLSLGLLLQAASPLRALAAQLQLLLLAAQQSGAATRSLPRVILHNILPEGAEIPANRGQLALLVWNTAGRPEPVNTPAFADVADADTAKAAQWCVEQGIMEAKTAETFKPEGWTPKLKVIEVWNKAFPKQ